MEPVSERTKELVAEIRNALVPVSVVVDGTLTDEEAFEDARISMARVLLLLEKLVENKK